MVIVDAPLRVPPWSSPNPERNSANGFTPGCRAKYLSSYRRVASISSGEISRNEVQIRYFWSDVRVTRSNLPFRSRTHCENEMLSSKGGFGRLNQTQAATAMQLASAINEPLKRRRRIV